MCTFHSYFCCVANNLTDNLLLSLIIKTISQSRNFLKLLKISQNITWYYSQRLKITQIFYLMVFALIIFSPWALKSDKLGKTNKDFPGFPGNSQEANKKAAMMYSFTFIYIYCLLCFSSFLSFRQFILVKFFALTAESLWKFGSGYSSKIMRAEDVINFPRIFYYFN